MDIWDPRRGLICLVLALTYGVQLVQICLLPVPSSFSTFSLLRRRLLGDGASCEPALLRLILLAACAIGSLLAAFIPLVICLRPSLYGLFRPLFAASASCLLFACLFLLVGSVMSLAAVLTLRRGARFDASGETEVLITSGIFCLNRHPVLMGLGLIYLGFFLLMPSLALAAGLLLFVINARARMEFEEMELSRRFGQAYQAYAAKVGRLGPRHFRTSIGE